MRTLPLLFVLIACDGADDAGGTDACRLADAGLACPECADGVVRCTLDGITEERLSCGGCQAEAALIRSLCEAGSTVTEAEIRADGVCVPVSD